jgi:hypothetical protein
MSRRLAHDEAFLLAQQAVAVIAHLLPKESRKDTFSKFYSLAKEAISKYAEASERERQRLRPEKGETR